MKNNFKTSRTVKTDVCSFNTLSFVLLILVTLITVSAQGQTESAEPCNETEFPFTGVPEATLCDELGGITYDLFIGLGTPITHSSQISPLPSKQIRIVGDFTIDNNFLLDFAVVNIDPGVSILMDENASLTIDNSKLFACNGLWNGIVMNNFTWVNTMNNTQIEDAEAAIQSIDKAYTFLEIENTIFNRDRIGMRLENAGASPHSPVAFIFRNNIFECDAPLNGTADEITAVGVQIKNSYSTFLDNPNSTNNLFRKIQNGITAEGKGTDLNIYDYEFSEIRNKGIYFKGGRLKAIDCTFEHILNYGIHFFEARQMELLSNDFFIREHDDALSNRHMVHVEAPLPGNSISIGAGNYFLMEGLLNDGIKRGIRLETSGFSEMNASIHNCAFDLLNTASGSTGNYGRAIDLDGNFSANSDVDIEINTFNTNTTVSTNNRGVYCGGGVKNNIHLIGNDFQGGGWHIDWRGSDGQGNEVTQNEHFQSAVAGRGLRTIDFQNLSVCSNTNHAASIDPYGFTGANNGMTFSGNVTFGGTNHSLWLAGDDPVIDQQIQTGNEWYPGLHPAGGGQFTTVHPFMEHDGGNEALINLSKFFVHTQQSLLLPNGQYSFFSEYHPALIDPDVFPLEDVFFDFESGTPNISCIVQLTNPNGTDKAIADGTYASLMGSPATAWDAERHLYQKLMSNPGYENSYIGFSVFLQANANSNIGQFYQAQQKIYEAAALPTALQSQLDAAMSDIAGLDGQIKTAQSNSTLTGAMLDQYFDDRHILSQEIETAMNQYETHRSSKLAEAETIVHGIGTSSTYEGYRKTVFEIFLQSQLYQGAIYTPEQIKTLQEVAMLCSREAGMVTYVAQGLLTDCELAEIQAYIEACEPVLEVQPRSSQAQNAEMLGGTPEKGFYFYPNPNKGKLVLSNHKGMAGTAEVFSPAGQLLQSHAVAAGESFWGLDLPSGIYLFKMSFEDGEVISDKLIITR